MSKSCFYCDVYPRNPCIDKDVASWIRYNVEFLGNHEKDCLIIAAQLIERYL